ncbi:MAG: SAM-dependent methyltransferase [Marmoricola sp.]|jgi:MPBQ/MSBQ methyltransferase|nr:SAM-dependent methyltransferase [Marmoricola sp.]
MDVRELVRGHYGHGNLGDAILSVLAEAGTDLDALGPADLVAVDQLHAGGAAATKHVLERLELEPGQRLLDVGCGIGGTSRMAAMAGADVTGIDLTPEFVEAATQLTARVGLGDRARFVTTPGESLPFDDGSYDVAVMVHVGMNIPDKAAVFAEVHRVLAPAGTFAIYEQMRTGPGDLPYPLPWAEDERSSFVESAQDYIAQLEGAGFTVEVVDDYTAATLGPPPAGPLSPVAVFGPVFAQRVGNNVAATRAGLLGAIVLVARA